MTISRAKTDMARVMEQRKQRKEQQAVEDFEYEEDPIKAYNIALNKKRKLTICCGSFYILIKLKEGLNG